VFFEWRGRHGEPLEPITPADVRWIGDLLARLTKRQWTDAFSWRYTPAKADRFISRRQRKIEAQLLSR
jgi:hypothetical protein